MATYVHKRTGEILETSLYPGKQWSAVTKYYDKKTGKEKLRFKLHGATIDLEEV